ncbi:MAG: helix-turn-helix domain-containing protein [Bacteroidaceae bacterium]|nr:helix-turn-helix domain-containing protein [Bacteroidaceae bacterium]
MKKATYIILLCAAVALTAGCADEKAGGSMSEKVYTALTWRDDAMEYDRAGQMRIAELYYRKSYEILKDNPSQDWDIYAEAGYRYACMLYQRDDMEGALAVVNEMLDKAEGQKEFPTTVRTGLLSLMAQCQLHLAMPEAAKQTFAKAYQNELTVLGGEEKGDFNLAIMCSNIFYSLFEIGEYDEAKKWLDRYECEILACEKFGIGDSALIEEHKGSIALYKARYLQATGRMGEAATVYAAIPRSRIFLGENMLDATGYLMAAGRYDEAAYWYEQSDSTFLTTIGTETTFDNIVSYLSPRYFVYRKAGRTDKALAMADSICAHIDSALVHQKKSDAAELAVIYQTHEKDMQLANQRFTISLHRLFAVALVVILLLIAWQLWRSHIYNKVLSAKNRHLLAEIEKQERKEQQAIEQLNAEPEATLTTEQQLYRRLCTIMSEQRPYTNEALNRDTLARLLGTNAKYVEQAIRECSDGETVGDFITRHRLEYVTHLLRTTDDSISLIGELSGIPNRATLARLFRNAYGMTCSEYREAVKSKATE